MTTVFLVVIAAVVVYVVWPDLRNGNDDDRD